MISEWERISGVYKGVRKDRESTSPQAPLPGIQASMSYFMYALAPSSSDGISRTLYEHMSDSYHSSGVVKTRL